ncbi:hypothetical protein BDP81DRAFT_182166 [Colletotrichum phormii]|uniref:Secreted protein n=1 Tax=Colletotrichum phormii TaxID=359342 RepID=A0AAJ0EI69_9PEZI|nr:uncharacterized protein BDP81DRAFT_182166 [Colletotrichum phormii]KAK1639714.1 hypothetical protein BDP81DRAFT_182166 [Colletotrichum phormii]
MRTFHSPPTLQSTFLALVILQSTLPFVPFGGDRASSGGDRLQGPKTLSAGARRRNLSASGRPHWGVEHRASIAPSPTHHFPRCTPPNPPKTAQPLLPFQGSKSRPSTVPSLFIINNPNVTGHHRSIGFSAVQLTRSVSTFCPSMPNRKSSLLRTKLQMIHNVPP